MPTDLSESEGGAERATRRKRRREERAFVARPRPTFRERIAGVALLSISIIGACLTPLLILGPDVTAAMTFGMPIAIGIAAGMLARDHRGIVSIGAATAGIGIVVATLFIADEIGPFCAIIYSVIAMPPAYLAAAITLGLRRRLRRRALAARRAATLRHDALLLLLAYALPLGWHAAEQRWPTTHAPESLAMERIVAAPLAAVWESRLAFPATGPFSAEAIHAPLPREASGRAHAVGDVKRLSFDRGTLAVRLVRVVPGRELVAEVIEQTIERRALRLHTVTLSCEPLAPEQTRVAVRLDFTPLMAPRWYWRPFERLFGGLTFDALLDGWEAGATEPPRIAPPAALPPP